MPKLIDKEWRSFSERCISVGAHPDQRREMRVAFYAGALVLFNLMMNTDEGDEPTEADMQKVSGIADELETFAAAASEGRF